MSGKVSLRIYRRIYLKLFIIVIEARPSPCYGCCGYSAHGSYPWGRPCPWLNMSGTRDIAFSMPSAPTDGGRLSSIA